VKKIFRETKKTFKKLPVLIWAVAIVVPGGFLAIGVYAATKIYLNRRKNGKKE